MAQPLEPFRADRLTMAQAQAQPQAPVAVVENVLDAASCAALIARIDAGAHELTRVRDERGIHQDASVRNNTRVWFDDAQLAERIFAAVRSEIDAITARAPAFFGGAPRFCETTFRGYRYRVGERFAPHVDTSFAIDDRARTLLTVLVYLNCGDGGGRGRGRGDVGGAGGGVGGGVSCGVDAEHVSPMWVVPSLPVLRVERRRAALHMRAPLVGGATRFPELCLEVQPIAGRACIFPHVLLHEGAVVEQGTKYALRTNVIFA